MRFLVTGGSGFIGSHLVEALATLGHRVIVLDNFSTGKRENLQFAAMANVEVIEGDIRDESTLNDVMPEVDGVFHQAALVSVPRSIQEPKLSFDINVNGTMNVFEAARRAGVKRVVYASSAAVYGDNSALPLSEGAQKMPLSPYGLDKLQTEAIGQLYQSLYGLEPIALRYFNVYGPRQDPSSPYSGVISIFTHAILHEQAPVIFGDGLQSRDFVYVDDVVQANLAAMFCSYDGFRVYNVGTGQASSLKELFYCICTLLGRELEPRYVAPRSGDIRHSLSDIKAIIRDLGYTPKWTLEKGLSRMLKP